MLTVVEEEVTAPADQVPAPRCSCFDEDCAKVVSPAACWVGNELLGGIADGYCPLLLQGGIPDGN